MNVPTPKYFVLTSDGELHGYNREDILKCDIATNSHTPPERIFKLSPNATGTIAYRPITRAELDIQTPPPQLATIALQPAA